ncbi:hypothetical protein [Burkholderia cenocepacia]|uniref:hypothetical protein n=1 Tax=Burkholderia cenocepacia TaxID=95486 RepID=UPI002B246DBC|nr:hypothetical protein [Burkholderia cenocepacia]MEB2554082.1 hypothetical protein [Burkholderia cenocepacia]
MKINVQNVGSGKYCEVTVDHNDTTIKIGWLDAEERRALADTLREAADELCPDDVSYSDLEAAWKRDQALEDADDSKLPTLPEGCNPKLHDVGPFFDEDQMREYARAAIAAAREA